jgi:hypothetical protein
MKPRAKTSLLALALAAAAPCARADGITYSVHAGGEWLTSSSSGDYIGYRQGDSGVTNNWYRWVVKVEKTGSSWGYYNFKFDVPEDFASNWRDSGNGIKGLRIRNQSNSEITGAWNDTGSTNKPAANGFIQLYRIWDGGDEGEILTSNNFFTIEYLCRVGSNHVATALRTNGFRVADGGDIGGNWDSYVHNTVATPIPYGMLPDCAVSGVAAGNGTVSPTNQTVKQGEVAVFSISAADFHHIAEIRTNGVSAGSLPERLAATNFSWRVLEGPAEVTAVFSANLTAHDVPESWLAAHDLADDTGDPDEDSQFTWQEWHADTDPTTNASCLRMAAPTETGLEWTGGTGAWQQLERAADLAGDWAGVWSNPPPNKVTNSWPTPASGFYRLRAWRAPN